MDSVLNTTVSCFKNYNTPVNPKPVNLLAWLKSPKYARQVALIRSEQDKARRATLKASLPAITPHGTFTYRSEVKLVRHSGLVQFDIDFQENRHITNYSELREEICKLVNVAYCGLSVSGTGFWGLIPIAYPEKHRQHFDFVFNFFKERGIIIDKKPRSVASLRGYSYDPEAYLRQDAKPLASYHTQPPVQQVCYGGVGNSAQAEVEALISLIARQEVDIAPCYDDWLSIGFALADEFGEGGRLYFHQVSQYYRGYRHREADRQYDRCLRSAGSGITIRTFFHACKLAGLSLPAYHQPERIAYRGSG